MSQKQLSQIVRTVLQMLETPSLVDAGALRLAEDVLAIDGYEGWGEVLNDPEHDGRMMMAELLLFPDTAARIRVESLLVGLEWTEVAKGKLVRSLTGASACFTLPDGRKLCFVLTEEDAFLLVRRLRLGRGLPAAVQTALDGQSFEVALMARVRLRLSRFLWTDKSGAYVASLIMKLGRDPELMMLLDFFCLFLETEGQSKDLAGAMIRKRRESERHLKSYCAFQQRLDKSNYETMHLTGDRAPHVEPGVLGLEIEAMDRLCPVLFGVPCSCSVIKRDLGHISVGDGARGLLHLIAEDE